VTEAARKGAVFPVCRGRARPDRTGELDFAAAVAANQLWFKQSGNDLVAEIMGTHDQVTVVNWFGAAASQLQEITTADGSKLDRQLSQLVQAMATYGAANPGFDPTAAIQAPGIPRCKAPSPPPGTIDS
jgi:hypothetical protein